MIAISEGRPEFQVLMSFPGNGDLTAVRIIEEILVFLKP